MSAGLGATIGGATFDPEGVRRFNLWREWAEGPAVTWVMLNPSLAGEEADDPTIRRVVQFSKDWGFGMLRVVNLSPMVDPYAAVPRHDYENRSYIEAAIEKAAEVVVAWGTYGEHATFYAPVRDVCRILTAAPSCLGVNANGSPKHPLYVRRAQERQPWPGWKRYAPPSTPTPEATG